MHPATLCVNTEGTICEIVDHQDREVQQLHNNLIQERKQFLASCQASAQTALAEGKNLPRILDYEEHVIMPGIIDCNVNLQEPAKENWEGFEYGTSAAASGGVTTLVDLPIMKRPILTTNKNLLMNIEATQNKVKVDVALLVYLNDQNLKKIQKFVEQGIVFGFITFLSAPLNRKLDEITEQALLQALSTISELNQNILLYIEAIASDGRHMYAKSPFRKEKLQKRLSQDIPKTLNLMAFAFPDGNEADDSSESEDGARPAILSIEKLDPPKEAKTSTKVITSQFFSSPDTQLNTHDEPSSALLRERIRDLRQDAQNIAVSELMLYETNTSNSHNIEQLNQPTPTIEDSSGSSEQYQPNKQHKIRDKVQTKINISSLNEDPIQSATQRINNEEAKMHAPVRKPNSGQSPRSKDLAKVIRLTKGQIDFGAAKRENKSTQNLQQKKTFTHETKLGGLFGDSLTPCELINEKSDEELNLQSTKASKQYARKYTVEVAKQPTTFEEKVESMQESNDVAVPKTTQHFGNIPEFLKKRNNSTQHNQGYQQSKFKLKVTSQEEQKQDPEELLKADLGAELNEDLDKEPKRASEKCLPLNNSNQEQSVIKRRSQNLGDFKPSPLIGGSAGKKSSFMERRKQLMAQKQSTNQLDQSSNPISSVKAIGSLVGSSNNSPLPLPKNENFGLKLISAHQEPTQDCEEEMSPSVYNSLAPLKTRKKDENEDQNLKLQQNYKFFLSLQPVSFEENGVAQVEKLLSQIKDIKESNFKIHFINFSSNSGLDKIRSLKKESELKSKITYEIAPHHLMFSSQDIQDKETKMKCCPPIRDSREQILLQLSFKKRYFDIISSQHFPVDPLYKNVGDGNFFKAFNGVSTLGFTLQAMWTLFKQTMASQELEESKVRDLQINYFAILTQVLCENPARILGINSKKGSLEVGKQADLVVFDPDEEWVVEKEDIYNKFEDVCIYKGKQLWGRVKSSFLKGEQIYDDQDVNILKSNTFGTVLQRKDFNQTFTK